MDSSSSTASSSTTAPDSRPQAGPLPRKIGEIGGEARLREAEEGRSSSPIAPLPDRHPEERSPTEAAVAVAADSTVPSETTASSTPLTTHGMNSTDSLSKKKRILSFFKPKHVPSYYGLRLTTLLACVSQCLAVAATIVGWYFTASRVGRSDSTTDNQPPSTGNDSTSNNTSSAIFIHVVFGVVTLVQLLFLERRIFRLRAQRYSYVHPGQILPSARLRAMGDPSLAFSPWNRPPLPTYAAALAQSGVGTGDVEDHLIAAPPPPAYGNTRGSTFLLSGFLRNSLRAERPASVHSTSSQRHMSQRSERPLSYNNSSDYFEEEDPAFLHALDAAVLPGDVSESESDEPEPPPPGQPSLKRPHAASPEPVDEAIYGPSRFGDFGEYMQRKRAKIQIQNSEIVSTAKTQIFKGVAVYVNGWTAPSVQELKTLLIENGGIFEPYLDRKSLVTHIVTCNLTEAKIRLFKNMKVVRPEWLTESVKAGSLLHWRDFMYVKGTGPADTQGVAPRAIQIPSYATDTSNPHAQRAMADPSWRSAHTSAAPGFIKGFYENSRLHFLSTMKLELQQLVREAQARAEVNVEQQKEDATLKVAPVSPWKGKGRSGEERVIMHCDFDCFFVSVGLLTRPELRGKPVVVCHSQGTQGGSSSTSEVACASYEARTHGIKNGMSLQQARKLCPTVLTMPYEFERYKDVSLKFYTVLMSHADDLEAVSIDEALIDVTVAVNHLRSAAASAGSPHDPAKDFAERIRAEVKQATECEISIGVSHNILLARLATRRAKPAGSLHLVPSDVPDFIATLQITDLWGFAGSHRDKALEKLGSTALKDLANKSRASLSDALGKKTGEKLYSAIRGIDDTELRSDKQRKSVSAEVNYGIRFESNNAAETFIFQLATEIEARLNAIKMLGRSVTLKIMKRDPSAAVEPPKFMGHGACEVFNKQTPLAGPGGRATSDAKVIGEHAWRILRSFNFDPKELRGIGIHIQKLEPLTGAANTEANQKTLPFKLSETYVRSAGPPPDIVRSPPLGAPSLAAGPSTDISLPKIEEVDQEVFRALPLAVRQELEDGWRRRSESPFPGKAPAREYSRARSAAPDGGFPRQGSVQPAHMQRAGSRTAPRKGIYLIDKKSLNSNRIANAFLRPSDADLHDLGIDPDYFAGLDRNSKRETLSRMRIIKERGSLPKVSDKRLILKPRKYSPPPDLFRQPPPYAKYPERPTLRQRGSQGTKPVFTETDDVQNLLEWWINTHKEFPPREGDVDFLAKFLEKSVDSERFTDTGVERAVAILKWWLVLLRRYWGDYEHFESRTDDADDAMVAEAWWKAFRDVKERMDVVARKKFGGRLSLR
ncbi:hypothetical protein GGX14DRAFT_629326 [Mycena pura]|uniref:DNA repair protein REV1 n=1 Tax=Mycena pura TaxID=153505 RepID=A0AAD6YRR8_9AGAR|nr:hypothetical protein GGX14DRAFT_629326 [Mycena pura]